MEEKVVLLTGATSGIGAHTVQFLVEKKGYRRLAIVARTKVARLTFSVLGCVNIAVLHFSHNLRIHL